MTDDNRPTPPPRPRPDPRAQARPVIEYQVGAGVVRFYGDTDIEVERSPATTRVKIRVRASAGRKGLIRGDRSIKG